MARISGIPKAEAVGMRGVVLKSHWWPTAVSVPYIRQLYTGPVEIWSSVTLNPISGGPELWAVESAAAMGARVVFLPTWSTQLDLTSRGFHTRIADTYDTFDASRIVGARFLDDEGRLTASGCDLLRYCHQHDLTFGTGHISWQESVALAEEARVLGFQRLIFNHPLSATISAPKDAARRVGELGGWVELCWTNVAPGRVPPEAAVEWIHEVGVEHVVVSTDYFRAANPAPPDLFRLLLGTLYDAGLSAEEIRQVAVINPARAMGLPEPSR